MDYIIILLPHLAFEIASWRITTDYFKFNEIMTPITGGILMWYTSDKFLILILQLVNDFFSILI